MIIHPPSPPLVMAALDAHPLAPDTWLSLFLDLVFALQHCLMCSLEGMRGLGTGGRGGQETFQEFPVDEDPARSHWEAPERE